DREGARNLWSMTVDGGDLRQLTELDASFTLSSVGTLGGKPTIFIESTLEGDLYRSSRPFTLPLEGGVPVRLHDAFGGAANASPDGARILFERGGTGWPRRGYRGPDNRNLWLFDPSAKTFAQVTEFDGQDGMARFVSADEFVFVSDRDTGALNLHRGRIGAKDDAARRLTDFADMDIHGLAVSGDGRTAVFGVLGDLWRLDLASEAAKPEKLVFTAPDDGLVDREFRTVGRTVSEAALSPDGKTMAFVADGDVFVRAVEDKSPTRRVTEGEARERDLCWSADGLTLFFASDRDGSDSLYAATVADTRAEARERGKPKKAEAPKPAEPAEEAKPSEPAAAPAAEAKTEPPAEPNADAPKPESKPDAKPDSKPDAKPDSKPDSKPEQKKDPKLDPARWADAVRFDVRALTEGPDNDRRPVASPDGSCLLFVRNLGDLARLDLATGEAKVIHPGWDDGMEYVFSPDGRLIALAESDQDFNSDIWILAADGSKPAVNITRHPDNDGGPRFSADGKILAFVSERTNEEVDVWVVMLDRDLEGYSQRDLDQYYKDATEALKKRKPLEPKAPAEKPAEQDAAKEPVDPFDGLELDDAYLRVRRVTSLPGDEGSMELLPAGDRLVFVGTEGKERALFSIKTDGTEQKRVATASRVVGLSFAGDRVVAIGPTGAQTIGLSGDVKSVDMSATSEIDLAKRNMQKLDEVSRIMGGKFYASPEEKKLDWPALTARYRDLAARARTPEEFDFVANMFIGHLDASHLGVRSPDGSGGPGGPGGPGAAPSRRAQGRIGVATVAAEGGRRVTEVLPDSPAALANPRIEPGDLIVAVDFEPVDPAKPLEAMLAGKSGQETVIAFRR
ncbi:MAG: hypothetical protein ACKO0W_11825, partial [Planctomycetota bacterium]